MKYIMLVAFSLLQLFATAHDITPTKEFKISGAVKAERIVTIEDILKLKQNDMGDVQIKNHKGDDKSLIKGLKGVLLKDVLEATEFVYAKPKELSEFYFVFTASDGYTNVYSWNEIYNTTVGDQLYIITQKDSKAIADMDERIQVISLADINSGRRYLKGLASIEVKEVK